MSKKQTQPSKPPAYKETIADQIKRIKEQNYGKRQTKELEKQLKNLELQLKKEQEKKKLEIQEKQLQKLERERKLEFEKKVSEVQKEAELEKKENKLLCRFFIEAPIEIQRSKTFVCPMPGCVDLHELILELTLEDTLEMEMEKVRTGPKVDEKVFESFLKKYIKEKELFEKKRDAVKSGINLFTADPSLFKDDENADDDKYENLNYSNDEEKSGQVEEE
ncbi:Zinc finger CCCH domain-containing protein 15 [Cucumispora dikerogammari]|nr:Zinc finger CCCH domain-containing protein 15 [Cucumispora dikerogammari]